MLALLLGSPALQLALPASAPARRMVSPVMQTAPVSPAVPGPQGMAPAGAGMIVPTRQPSISDKVATLCTQLDVSKGASLAETVDNAAKELGLEDVGALNMAQKIDKCLETMGMATVQQPSSELAVQGPGPWRPPSTGLMYSDMPDRFGGYGGFGSLWGYGGGYYGLGGYGLGRYTLGGYGPYGLGFGPGFGGGWGYGRYGRYGMGLGGWGGYGHDSPWDMAYGYGGSRYGAAGMRYNSLGYGAEPGMGFGSSYESVMYGDRGYGPWGGMPYRSYYW